MPTAPSETTAEQADTAGPPPDVTTDYYYIWRPQDAADPQADLRLVLTLWPGLFLGLRPRGGRGRLLKRISEPLLLVGTGLMIARYGWIYHPEAGAYLATSGFALLLAAWGYDSVVGTRRWLVRRKKKSLAVSS